VTRTPPHRWPHAHEASIGHGPAILRALVPPHLEPTHTRSAQDAPGRGRATL
jgi:hypothetical protein